MLNIFSFRTPDNIHSNVVLPGAGVVSSELQTKLEKYESKVAHCEKAAQEARGVRERAMYEELSRYYTELVADFRKAIAKHHAA
jgi:hypothetical protein